MLPVCLALKFVCVFRNSSNSLPVLLECQYEVIESRFPQSLINSYIYNKLLLCGKIAKCCSVFKMFKTALI